MEEARLPNAVGTKDNGKIFVILGWIFTALSVLMVLSIVFSPAAIVMGALAIPRGRKKQGIWIIVINAVLLILMLILGGLVVGLGYSMLNQQ